jgi:nicotinamidase-related amidase
MTVLSKNRIFICVLCSSLFFSSFAQNQYPPGESYLLVVDVQEQFYAPLRQDSEVRSMVQAINSVIPFFLPEHVIYIKAGVKALSISRKGFKVDTLAAPALDSNLRIVSAQIFTKLEGDAFLSPEFSQFIEQHRVMNFILVGLLAEKCISATANGGLEKGYKIWLMPEGILGKSAKSKAKVMQKLSAKGIGVISQKYLMQGFQRQ